ncbi:MAG: acyloxyacyl hydrolase [Anditalea sp.]
MKVRSFFLTLFLCMGIFEVNAQSITRLGAATTYGSIIAHSSDLLPISQTNPYGLSGSFQGMNTDQKSWEICNCFYYIGLQLSYHNFNNPEILGSAFSLTGTFEPILWQKDQWAFSLNSGIGISYLSKVFDPETNPMNAFFSVPVSFLVSIAPTLEYRFAPRWSGQLFLTYNHISNGGQSQPNRGMNYPMVGIGLNHYLSRKDLPSHSRSSFSPSWKYYGEAAYTNKEAVWTLGRKPVLSLTAGAFKRLSSINAMGGGLELTKDYSLDVKDSRWEALMPAPYIAHHFLFGKIDFSQRMALYTHKPNAYNDHLFYQRYVLQYQVWSNWSMGIGLKTHGHVAENIDFRLGWRF